MNSLGANSNVVFWLEVGLKISKIDFDFICVCVFYRLEAYFWKYKGPYKSHFRKMKSWNEIKKQR